MRIAHASLAAFVCLAACSDDDGDGTKTGKFIDSAVKGLHYQTESQSGLTNDAGEFRYKTGETVTFAVGGIVLGSAAGAGELTPFDLAGMAAPRTMRELNAALVNDRGLRVAGNIAMFLQALDADRDAANGIDLGTWDSALASETMSFAVSLTTFYFDRFPNIANRYPGIWKEIPPGRALAHLLMASGFSGQVKVATLGEADDGNDGSVNTIYASVFDDNGRLISQTLDEGADGVIDSIAQLTYNARGDVLTDNYGASYDANPDFEDRQEYAYAYNDVGARTESVNTSVEENVVTQIRRTVFTYDAAGREVSSVENIDAGGNGSVNSRFTVSRTFDARGYLVTQRDERDDDVDGVPNWVRTTTYVVDERGNTTSDTRETDTSNDGTVDSRNRNLATFDEQGRRLTYAQEALNGTGVVTSRTLFRYTYDAYGRYLTYTSEYDNDADGVLESRTHTVYQYDDRGYQVGQVSESDNDGNGTIDSRTVGATVIDEHGAAVSSATDYDDDNDGTPDSRSRNTTTFDEDGNLVSTLDESDSNANGDWENANMYRVTTSAVANGLEAWLANYIED